MSQTITPITNLLVIDSQVSDWQSLASATTPGTAVLILDSSSDGLTQISDYLTTLAASTADFVPLQSIQIMSHGSAGSLFLGSSTITQDNLSSYSEQLANMGSSLTDTGDILLYGCDVAADQNGVDFINQLAVLTNAEVAASTDLTGSAALGGDWQLEASTGTIESALAINIETVNSYTDTLSIKVGSNTLSEAYLSVYDSTQALTFVLDLGLTMGDLVSNLSNDAFTKSYDLAALTATSTDGKWATFAAGLNTSTTVFGVLTSGNAGRLLATGPAISPAKFPVLNNATVAVTTTANHIASVNTATQIDNTGAAVDTALNLSAIISDADISDTGQHDQRNPFSTLNNGKSDAGASIKYGTAGNFYYYAGTAIPALAVQTWTLDATTGTLTYAKAAGNHAPTTSLVTLASILEHSQARVITQAELLSNAVDLDGNTLTATGLSLASSNGTLVDNADGTWSYTPLLNDVSSVSFNYNITDSVSPTAGTVAATATLAITPVTLNHAPTTSLVTLASILEHSQARVITQAELLSNAVDLDGNTLTATGLSLASSNGTLVDNADGTWSYTPLLNDVSSVSFNYNITDSVSPTAGTVAATATLAITPVTLNGDPVADLFKSFGNGTNEYIKPEAYVQNAGQNLDLKYQIIDNTADAVIIGSTSNDFIKLAGTGNKAANGGAGDDVLDGSTGSSFLSGGDGIDTFFLDGRAAGVTWSTLTDFTQGQDKATIWGWVKGVSTINAGYTYFNTGGATDYTGLTLHIQNLLPDGSASGATNSALNSLTLTGHTLAQFGASSLADLNTQIINGTNTHFIVGQTTDDLGVHGFLSIS